MTNKLTMLSEACSHVKLHPGAYPTLCKKTSKSHALRLSTEVTNTRKMMSAFQKENRSRAEGELCEYLTMIDLSIALLCDITFYCVDRHKNSKPLLQFKDITSKGDPEFFIRILFNNLTNNLIAIRQLLGAGLDLQARTIIRAFVELSDISLAFLSDKKFCEKYMASPDELTDANRYFKDHLSPGKVRQILETFHAGVLADTEAVSKFFAARRQQYSWLSTYAHSSNVIVQTVGTFPGMVVKSDELMSMSIGGLVSPASVITAHAAADLTGNFLMILYYTLIKVHDWWPTASDDELEWIFFRFDVLRNIKFNTRP